MTEKQTALFKRNRWVQNCEKRFRRLEGKNYRSLIRFIIFTKGATIRGSSIARIPEMSHCTFVIFKDTLVGTYLIAPELMGHVDIPYKWQEFLFHRGCSHDVTSILKSGLMAGGRECKQGTRTIFFTPLNPFADNPDEEEPCDDLSKPRKVHYHSKWKPRQDAVYWINLARAQDKWSSIRANQIPRRNFYTALSRQIASTE